MEQLAKSSSRRAQVSRKCETSDRVAQNRRQQRAPTAEQNARYSVPSDDNETQYSRLLVRMNSCPSLAAGELL